MFISFCYYYNITNFAICQGFFEVSTLCTYRPFYLVCFLLKYTDFCILSRTAPDFLNRSFLL